MSLRARIFFVFAAAVVTGFALLAWWITGDLRYRYGESFEEVMVDSSRLLAEQLAADWSAPPESRFLALQDATLHLAQQRFRAPIFSVVKTRADIRIYVTDGAGRLLFDSRPGSTPGEDYSQWRDIALTLRGEYGARTTRELLAGDDGTPVNVSVSYVAAPILVDGARVGIVSLGKPQTNIERFIDSARRNLVLAVLLASALAIALALLLYNWVSRPLQSLVTVQPLVREAVLVRDPALVDRFVFAWQHAHHAVALDLHLQIRIQAVMGANALAALQFPSAGTVAKRLGRKRTDRADVPTIPAAVAAVLVEQRLSNSSGSGPERDRTDLARFPA